jgi:hypothetical protein
VKKACSGNTKLLEQVKKLVSSFYWQEKVRSKDGILLALISKPEEYEYTHLVSAELKDTHTLRLEDIKALCQKYAFSNPTTAKILQKQEKVKRKLTI